jgi:3-hydroxybutyryl-CoA dehydrogenase
VRGEDVRAIGVVGCGLMGSGIAEVAARAGQRVVVLETSVELLEAGRARIERSLGRAVDRGKLADGDRTRVLGRIEGTVDPEAFGDVDLVIEAATEDRATKLDVFRRLGDVTKPETILASNTSSIPIVDLAAVSGRPDRVLGLHFFNPVPVMNVVEIVRAITTSDETIGFGRGYCSTLGKTTVLSKDRAGFIVNTLLIPYLNDAIAMLDEGFASREDIDAAINLGLNQPMGPLKLADLIGLDTCLQIGEVLYAEFKERRFAPPPLLRRMVAAGHLGRKSGRGFYPYDGVT